MLEITKYYELLDQWMSYFGFEPITIPDTEEADRVYKRSRIEASKFGKVDCYCFIKYKKEKASGEELKQFSWNMHLKAMKHRTGAPLGFGAMMIVYSLFITDKITNELAEFINNYCPKHFGLAEFPAVLDLSTENLYYYPHTPLWGYAYYAQYRLQCFQFFSPKGWKEIHDKQTMK